MSYLDHLKKKKSIGTFSIDRKYVEVKVPTRPKTSAPNVVKSSTRATTAKSNANATNTRDKQISKSSTANYPPPIKSEIHGKASNYEEDFDKIEPFVGLNDKSTIKSEQENSFNTKLTKSKESFRSIKSAKSALNAQKMDFLIESLQTVDRNIANLNETIELSKEDAKKLDVFAIELNPDCSTKTGIALNGQIKHINNHIGNIDLITNTIKQRKEEFLTSFMLKNRLLHERQKSKMQSLDEAFIANEEPKRDDELKLIENDITTMEGYLNLIRFCFKYVGKSGEDLDDVDFGFFKVSNKTPLIKIQFKNSDRDYTIEEILSEYFRSISNSVQTTVGKRLENIIVSIPSDYGIFEKTDIKKSLENINLNPLRIVSIPIAKAITLNQSESSQDSEEIKENILKVLIDMNSGPLSVNLYEKKMNEMNSIKVKSSLIETNLTSDGLFELNKQLLKSKFPMEYQESLDNDDKQVLAYCEQLENQFKKGEHVAKLLLNDPSVEINVDLDEIKSNYGPYIELSAELLQAILSEQGLDLGKDIERIDICSKSFTSVTELLMNEKLKLNGIEKQLTHATEDIDTLPGTIELATNLIENKQNTLINTLNCNLGINVFGGLFLKKIARGTQLPCEPCVTLLTTMVDNQESCVIKIIQGERPFSRYCHELGTLTVPNLPLEKAGNVQIEVTLLIDKDEILTVQAYEPRTSQNLQVQINRASSALKEDVNNLVLDAIKYKKHDDAKREAINKVRELLKNVRQKYLNTKQEEVALNEVNRFVNWFNAQESIIDEIDMSECLKCIQDFVEKLELSQNKTK